MPCKRIVACLDVAGGRTVKGTRFLDLRDAGDPVELAARYASEGVDELVMLDVTATVERRSADVETVRAIARAIDIPLTVGGGIRQVEDFKRVLHAGADKVAINSAALEDPQVLSRAALAFGSQCVVVAIDAHKHDGCRLVRTHAGAKATGVDAPEWARRAQQNGAGEVLLTSIDADGTKSGFDLGLTQAVASAVSVPIIASGGAACAQSFADLFTLTDADAGLAASIFHCDGLNIGDLKHYLAVRGIEVRS